jgi:hypothetical protein
MVTLNSEISRLTQAWIEAGHLLARDPSARIACPSCGRGVLVVSDETIPDGRHVERWMRCNACGRANTILLTFEQASHRPSASTSWLVKTGGGVFANQTFDWTDKASVEDLVKRAVKSIRGKG